MGSISFDELSAPKPHVVLFPFMSKGHTIPILHLARLLIARDLAVTVFTTSANRPFISHFLTGTTVSIIDLPFPHDVEGTGIPQGIESTDKLPSISMIFEFALATERMKDDFERVLETLPRPIIFMVCDDFLWWTQDSADKFDIIRLSFMGMSAYATAVCRDAAYSGVFDDQKHHSDDELIALSRLPWISITKNDFSPEFFNRDTQSLSSQFHAKVFATIARRYGQILNSFYELEPVFVDYLKNEVAIKAWCIGPLCLTQPPFRSTSTTSAGMEEDDSKPTWVRWLDQKLEKGSSVLYVAFGSQAEVSPEQLREIAMGLEESYVNFLWVIRKNESELPDNFGERVGERGIVVSDWVDQMEILKHESVKGFLSHCGWNSVLESVCVGVPILAWPFMAEQHLNARMVHEEIKIGLRVETINGSVRGFVSGEELRKKVKELMEGENGRQVRKNVNELSVMAKKAVEKGGSSWQSLDSLIQETCDKAMPDVPN
uniref:Glycosyltransferase n=1 Tax=Polygala tenuifolia TaxID=355332 RepID=A0A3G3NBF8_9FABA|nr:UDP-glucosyltransferase UGT90A13 [Polygala tenuifolia]